MIRLFVDFNYQAEDGRFPLNTFGSLNSIKLVKEPLIEGQRVILSDGEIEMEANLSYDFSRNIWMADINNII